MCICEFLKELGDLAEVTSVTLRDYVCVAWAMQAQTSAWSSLDLYNVGKFGGKRFAKDLQQELGWKAQQSTGFRKWLVLAHFVDWAV